MDKNNKYTSRKTYINNLHQPTKTLTINRKSQFSRVCMEVYSILYRTIISTIFQEQTQSERAVAKRVRPRDPITARARNTLPQLRRNPHPQTSPHSPGPGRVDVGKQVQYNHGRNAYRTSWTSCARFWPGLPIGSRMA